MQPLDKTVYGPLKRNYNEECDRWMLKNPAQRISMFQQGALFGAAFVKTAGMQKAVNSFERTGLWLHMSFVMKTFCSLKLQMNQSQCLQQILNPRRAWLMTCLRIQWKQAQLTVGDNVDASLALACEEGHHWRNFTSKSGGESAKEEKK